MFDELLSQVRSASVYAINQLLAVIAQALASTSVRNGPVLAVEGAYSLFQEILNHRGRCGHAMIDGLCKAEGTDRVEKVLQQMLDIKVLNVIAPQILLFKAVERGDYRILKECPGMALDQMLLLITC